jgi:hypothetical protein
MLFEIKHRWSGAVLFSVEAESFRFAVEAAVKSKANLSKADLSEANLSEADLSEADLSWADLSEANLSEANLSKANLSWADLSEADLSEADLSEANLSEADLSWADLSEANLSEANLSKADLSKADLSEANLSEADPRSLRHIKHDIWGILLHAKSEVPFLRQAIVDGKVNGSVYSGECACLCGTIANARKCAVEDLQTIGISMDSSSMAERFFMAIKEGDTPETNPASKLVLEWVDEFLRLTEPSITR